MNEIIPLSLEGAPALIEHIWPSQKMSIEARKERKAGSGQTLTALGSYWKGRKPLVLVRACVLATLLPATSDPEGDLALFETLMAIDDVSLAVRDVTANPAVLAQAAFDRGLPLDAFVDRDGISLSSVAEDIEPEKRLRTARWAPEVAPHGRLERKAAILSDQSYETRVGRSLRPEEVDEREFAFIWPTVNARLGTNASSLGELVEQLGIMRFGRRPRLSDAFAGGGSIPFEAVRVGCDVTASDLNPIACMLTWGALNVIGGDAGTRAEIDSVESEAARHVEQAIRELGFEADDKGNRAKAFLYCLETYCPETDWTVPICQSWVISQKRRIVIELVPNEASRRFDFRLVENATDEQMRAAAQGTKQGDALVYELDGERHRKQLKAVRGDHRRADGSSANALRPWELSDIRYRAGDVYAERLYCIQWMKSESLTRGRQETFFAAPTEEDDQREEAVAAYVSSRLAEWQQAGIVPDMAIEAGEETSRLTRERGWTHWHHLFSPRNLLVMGLMSEVLRRHPGGAIKIAHQANWNSKGCQWFRGFDTVNHTFEDQSLKTKYDYAARSAFVYTHLLKDRSRTVPISGTGEVLTRPASAVAEEHDIYITDPPYADAVSYHEITEFFIAWLRKNPPAPFDEWTWDSRRPLAIKGEGEDFRREMVAAYRAMADNMPANGLQIVMFTHQSGSVWADLAQIFWGAGLQVRSAWYNATETTSELKKGGYVQGTVILILRKRQGALSGYEDEIAQEIRDQVAHQIDTMVGLNQTIRGDARVGNLFEDADLQMAGYAAALRVLTGYTRIDGRDMTAEALRPRGKGEQSFVDRLIDFAVGVANEHMVPSGIDRRLWLQLNGSERFYLRMVEQEVAGKTQLDNYQSFARAFRVPSYLPFMADSRPNAARVKSARDFGVKSGFDVPEFGTGIVRATLFAINSLAIETDPDDVLEQLRDLVQDYFRKREDIVAVADYIASKRGRDDEAEGRHAGVLANMIRHERIIC